MTKVAGNSRNGRGGSKPGERRGGRQKGTPNRRTAELSERLAQVMGADWCAVTEMAVMTREADLKPEVKARLLAEIACYQAPKLRPRVADIEDETSLAEALQAARMRALRGAGGCLSLEGLVVMSTAPPTAPAIHEQPAPVLGPSGSRTPLSASVRQVIPAPPSAVRPPPPVRLNLPATDDPMPVYNPLDNGTRHDY